jgi:lipopolysaccharide transport system permease protein
MRLLAGYRPLLPALVYGAWLRIRMQFARTLLGSSWIGLSTLISMVVLGTIYGTLTGVDDWSAYWVYVALGLVSWNTLSTAINSSCTVLERARERLLNQPLPVGVVVLEEWLTTSLALLIALTAVLLVVGLLEPQIWLHLLQGGWLGLVNLLLGCLWITLLMAPIAVSLADIHQLVPVLLQIGFLASPILFYRQSLGALGWVSDLNPLYAWVRLARDPFLGQPHWAAQGLALIGQLLLVLWLLQRLDRRRMAVIRWL